MYKINQTFNINEATYSYEDFLAVNNGKTFCDDLNGKAFPNNTVTGILGATVLYQISTGDINIGDLCCTEYVEDCFYIFRKTQSGRLLPLRISIHPKTVANLNKMSRKFGTQSILNEVFGG